MTQFITYQTPDGTTAVISPAPNCGLTIEQIAAKDVPAGALWQIVDSLPPPDPSETLAAERAAMTCSPLQGKLALGEVAWSEVKAYVASLAWPVPEVVASAQEWRRLSPELELIGFALDYDELQKDELFRTAMEIQI